MKVLVTGGTGYLGRAIVRALDERGHRLTIFARAASGSGLPGSLVDGDVRDREAVARAARGCDAICHLAALVSIWQPRPADFDDINVTGLRNVLQVAAELRIPRMLYTSSFLALPPAGQALPLEANDYQRTKVAAERLAEGAASTGAALVCVYPGVVYGPGPLTQGNIVGRLISDHIRGRLAGVIGREHRWSYAYIDDVAAGHCAAIERGRLGARYILGGENATQAQMFDILGRLTGRLAPRAIPYRLASAIGMLEEQRVRLFGGLPLVTRGAIEIFRHDWPLDSRVAASELQYVVTPLAEGLRRTIEALRS